MEAPQRPQPPRWRGLHPAQRDEQGFVGGFAGVVFGLLIFVGGTLLIAFTWAVLDTKSATAEAARQAARTYVEAPDQAQAAAQADQAAAAALSGYGRSPERASVRLVAGRFSRCSRITIEVTYPAPLFQLPFFGSLRSGESVSSQHSEIVDPLRTGLPGVSSCP